MRLIHKIYHFIVDSSIPTLSGGVCFFLLINGGSYLFLLLNVFSHILSYLIPIIDKYMVDSAIKDILFYLIRHSASLEASIILLVTSLYSSSTLYYHFLRSAELILDTAFKRKRAYSFVMSLIIPLILFLLFVVTTTLLIIVGRISTLLSIPIFLIPLIGTIYVIHFQIIKTYSIKELYPGILFTVVYILIFTIGMTIYLSFFRTFKIVYGVLSFIIIFFFYIYLLTIGFFTGLKLNWKIIENKKTKFDEK